MRAVLRHAFSSHYRYRRRSADRTRFCAAVSSSSVAWAGRSAGERNRAAVKRRTTSSKPRTIRLKRVKRLTQWGKGLSNTNATLLPVLDTPEPPLDASPLPPVPPMLLMSVMFCPTVWDTCAKLPSVPLDELLPPRSFCEQRPCFSSSTISSAFWPPAPPLLS